MPQMPMVNEMHVVEVLFYLSFLSPPVTECFLSSFWKSSCLNSLGNIVSEFMLSFIFDTSSTKMDTKNVTIS